MDFSRRSFITSSGQALGAGWLALHWSGITAAAGHAHSAAANPAPHTFMLLTAEQARDVDAIASQIIPTDDLPGAHEAGAVYFIDQALGGFFAAHSGEYRSGYDEFAAAVATTHSGARFADLSGDRQIDYLHTVERTPFFQTTRFLTILGLLADPGYGGNRAGIGWKLIGFEDQHVFQPPFGHYDRDYPGFIPYAELERS
jgi:gluconate 2-dehydrogenase gamma chain